MKPTVLGPTPGPHPTGRRAGIPFGRVLGFPLHVRWSLLLLVALIIPLSGRVVGYPVASGFVVALLASVLLHELGHALTARRCGIGVRGITLEIPGGYTELTHEAPSPRVELLVALAGPAVSLALGLVAGAGVLVLPPGPLRQIALLVGLSNVIVAVFNALPGLPLDGGRALRAVVWWIGGDRYRATVVAGRAGHAVAGVTVAGAVGLYLGRFITELGLIVMIVVGLGLWQGAVASLRAARLTRRLPLLDLDKLTRPIVAVPTGTPLAEAQRRVAAERVPGAALAVADTSGTLIALVHPRAAEAVPAHRRPWVSVDSVARQLASIRAVPAGLRGAEVLRALRAAPANEYLVTSEGQVVGVLRATDVATLLRTGTLGPAA